MNDYIMNQLLCVIKDEGESLAAVSSGSDEEEEEENQPKEDDQKDISKEPEVKALDKSKVEKCNDGSENDADVEDDVEDDEEGDGNDDDDLISMRETMQSLLLDDDEGNENFNTCLLSFLLI